MTLKLKRAAGGVVLGLAMSVSGLPVTHVMADAATSTGWQHYLDCFGELGQPQHLHNCGDLNPVDPNGIAHTVHDGGGTPTEGCPVATHFIIPQGGSIIASLETKGLGISKKDAGALLVADCLSSPPPINDPCSSITPVGLGNSVEIASLEIDSSMFAPREAAKDVAEQSCVQ